MKRKLWIIILVVVLLAAVAMVVHYSTAYAAPDKPLICKAVSIYADGTRGDPVMDATGLRMTLPTPGTFYRPIP